MKVPLHSLVFDFTNSVSGIEAYEFLSIDKIKRDLIGKDSGYYINIEINNELKNRISSKLWLGERVIIQAKGMKRFEREMMSAPALEMGIQIFYVLPNDIDDNELMRGDGRAEVLSIDKVDFFKRITPKNVEDLINTNYRGITVVGDVHGQLEALMSSIEWAKKRNNMLIFLGDVIDYGVRSLDCIEEIYKLLIRNQAIFIIGNHERKIFKWLNKYNNKNIKIHLSESNKQTIELIKKMSSSEKKKWENKYRTIMNLGFTHMSISDHLFFVHASYHAGMIKYAYDRILPEDLEKLALFGEIKKDADWNDHNSSNMSYEWVKNIPSGMTVFVGHELRSSFKPHHEINSQGGQVYFIDTGSGKGGTLTTADLTLIEEDGKNKFIVQNFNSW